MSTLPPFYGQPTNTTTEIEWHPYNGLSDLKIYPNLSIGPKNVTSTVDWTQYNQIKVLQNYINQTITIAGPPRTLTFVLGHVPDNLIESATPIHELPTNWQSTVVKIVQFELRESICKIVIAIPHFLNNQIAIELCDRTILKKNCDNNLSTVFWLREPITLEKKTLDPYFF